MGGITDALAVANKTLDRLNAGPDDDLVTMARGIVLLYEYATRPCDNQLSPLGNNGRRGRK
jgi:hypothetical protein